MNHTIMPNAQKKNEAQRHLHIIILNTLCLALRLSWKYNFIHSASLVALDVLIFEMKVLFLHRNFEYILTLAQQALSAYILIDEFFHEKYWYVPNTNVII